MDLSQKLKDRTKIAYISMEIALESNIPTYSGGLGILSGDTIMSAADLEIPMVAVCLCYSSGYFYQGIDQFGNQFEKAMSWTFSYEFDKIEKPIKVQIEDKEVLVSAWLYKIVGDSDHILPVYLLTTDVKGNEEWMKKMTGSLYDSTSRWNRIVQEMILGIGSVKLLKSLGYNNLEAYHLNEGHGSFSILELYNQLGDLDKVREKMVFTTHTPVPAGHDRFDQDLVRKVFLDRFPKDIRKMADDNGKLNMTYLGMALSRYKNGVAQKHGDISRKMFPQYKDEIDAITNGVHWRWVSQPFKRLFDRQWKSWRTNYKLLQNAIELDDLSVFDAHIENKFNLISYVNGHSHLLLDEELITIGFARRFATYKRAVLLFHNIERLIKIAEGKCQFIFAGKAHPKDQMGKDFIKKITETSEKLEKEGVKVVFVENYNMDIALLLTAGVDVWLNTPDRYREASGTSGMKATLNGVPNLSVLDGWWLEGWKKSGGKPKGGESAAGWAIGPDDSDPKAMENNWDVDSNYIYDLLENYVIPKYWNHDEWIFMQKNAIALGAFFNTHRMVREYAKKAYLLKKQPLWNYIG